MRQKRSFSLWGAAGLLSLFVALLSVPFFHGSLTYAGAEAGVEVPDLTAKTQDGQNVRLRDLRGKWLLLYFYPKDDTPGCTQQACQIRDGFGEFQKAGVTVFGVSTQDAKSHQEFRQKHKLPFELLVDSDGKLGEAFGVKKIPVLGIYRRQSVLISPEGKVARFFENVDPATHAKVVLEVVSDLRKAARGVSKP